MTEVTIISIITTHNANNSITNISFFRKDKHFIFTKRQELENQKNKQRLLRSTIFNSNKHTLALGVKGRCLEWVNK